MAVQATCATFFSAACTARLHKRHTFWTSHCLYALWSSSKHWHSINLARDTYAVSVLAFLVVPNARLEHQALRQRPVVRLGGVVEELQAQRHAPAASAARLRRAVLAEVVAQLLWCVLLHIPQHMDLGRCALAWSERDATMSSQAHVLYQAGTKQP